MGGRTPRAKGGPDQRPSSPSVKTSPSLPADGPLSLFPAVPQNLIYCVFRRGAPLTSEPGGPGACGSGGLSGGSPAGSWERRPRPGTVTGRTHELRGRDRTSLPKKSRGRPPWETPPGLRPVLSPQALPPWPPGQQSGCWGCRRNNQTLRAAEPTAGRVRLRPRWAGVRVPLDTRLPAWSLGTGHTTDRVCD